MSAHTPGPWTLKDDSRMGPRGDVAVGYAVESVDDFVAFLDCGEWSAAEKARAEVARANARLIAAAPELLLALKRAHEHLDCWRTRPNRAGLGFDCQDGAQRCPACLVAADADAAIAKAEGRQ